MDACYSVARSGCRRKTTTTALLQVRRRLWGRDVGSRRRPGGRDYATGPTETGMSGPRQWESGIPNVKPAMQVPAPPH